MFQQDEQYNLFLKIVNERWRKATTDDLDPRFCFMLTSSLSLSGLATYLFYLPNIKAGQNIASQESNLGLSPELLQVLFVSGSLSINFLVNAYFAYSVPEYILSSLQSNPVFSSSLIAKLNHKERSLLQKIMKTAYDVGVLTLKSIPVALSTAQFLALSADSDSPEALIASQLVVYSLMHWEAVTDFVNNWASIAWKKSKTFLFPLTPEWKEWEKIQETKKTFLATYKQTLEQALFTYRILLEENTKNTENTENNLVNIHQLFDEIKVNHERASELMFLLLDISNRLNIDAGKQNINLFPFHLFNFFALNLCYWGYDMAVYYQSTKLCQYLLGHTEFCETDAFKIFFTLFSTFPLNYLISVVIAMKNTQTLWDYFTQKTQARSVSYQRFPLAVNILSCTLLWFSAWSWGTSVILNMQYIKEPTFLLIDNINAIIYNTFFNAFPIPLVASALVFMAMLQYMTFFKQDTTSIKRERNLENFLQQLIETTSYMEPEGFVRELANLQENEVNILLGKKNQAEILQIDEENLPDETIERDNINAVNLKRLVDAKPPETKSQFAWGALFTKAPLYRSLLDEDQYKDTPINDIENPSLN